MIYITRKLYNSQQGDLSAKEEKFVDKNWKEACMEYKTNLKKIKPHLPRSMQDFCEISLHDGIIDSFTRTKHYLKIKINGCGCCGPAGKLELIFYGVKSVKGLDNIINDWWLYEEVYLSKKGRFEYHVLLEKSEFMVVADEVKFIEINKNL